MGLNSGQLSAVSFQLFGMRASLPATTLPTMVNLLDSHRGVRRGRGGDPCPPSTGSSRPVLGRRAGHLPGGIARDETSRRVFYALAPPSEKPAGGTKRAEARAGGRGGGVRAARDDPIPPRLPRHGHLTPRVPPAIRPPHGNPASPGAASPGPLATRPRPVLPAPV